MRLHQGLWTLFFVCFQTAAFAQSTEEERLLPRCDGAFDLCGYVKHASKELVIPHRFERAFLFSEGFAAVRIDGRYGYIDRTGAIVIAPQFDLAGPFNQGHAEVLVGDQTGIIDDRGNIVVEPAFARIVPLTRDVMLVIEGKWQSAHFQGHEKLQEFGLSFYQGNKLAKLYNIRTGWISDIGYTFAYFDKPERGLFWATKSNRGPEIYGLLKSDGTWQVSPRYSHVQGLSHNRAVVRGKPEGNQANLKGAPWGAVDENGNLVVPLKYPYLGFWRAGYGTTQSSDKHGLVKKDGTLLAGRLFDGVDLREDGLLPRVLDGETWHSVRPDGTLVADQLEDRVRLDCADGLKVVEQSGSYVVSHPALSAPIKTLLISSSNTTGICDRPYLLYLSNKKFRFLTPDGRLIPEQALENTHSFYGAFAAVAIHDKWGLINEAGDFVLEPEFDKLKQSRNGIFHAQKNGREFWIDHTGTEVAEPPRHSKQDRARILTCKGGNTLFFEDGLWGMKRPDGSILIEAKYRALNCFSQGIAWAAAKDSRAWCPIGPDAEERSKPDCLTTYNPMIVTHHFPERFADDPHESSVLWLRALLDFAQGKRAEKPGFVRSGGTRF
ncbi:WG repeat-containing protein [Roseibium sediminicola]|uniref:WG repeat-containing protein n=1 Tax=Roseibium sediminicola TaxID=2933272 RepID=A0ABT0GQL0_9HYPH|nr:WG repeat-containing protein [Roseibium sp. CAU 1639]MCK7611155.1 WG repeat-containing protein [Roseibium sp. CAU 1639]